MAIKSSSKTGANILRLIRSFTDRNLIAGSSNEERAKAIKNGSRKNASRKASNTQTVNDTNTDANMAIFIRMFLVFGFMNFLPFN